MSDNSNHNLAPWATMVPAEWEVHRIGMVADIFPSNVDKHTIEGEQSVRLCNYTDVYKNDRITSSIEFMVASALPREIEKFQIRKGDVLATKDSESPDDIAVSSLIAEDLPGVLCGYHLAMIRPDARKIYGPFLAWVQASKSIRAQYEAQAVGVTRYALSQSTLKDALVPVPPLLIQPRIATYLDEQTANIDRLMEMRRRQMELLKEQRSALIQQAVTRGLNPNAPMKESGIPWLGKIPKHWHCAPLRRFWTVMDCKHLTVPFLDEGYPLASVSEVQSFELDLSQAKRTSEEFWQVLIEGGRQPQIGDLIYCRNTSVGATAYVSSDEPIAMGQDVCLIRSSDQNGRYLNHVLRSGFMTEQLNTIIVGATFKRINVADIKALIVLCPPKPEQDAIVNFIDAQNTKIDSTISAYARQLTLLAEYRAALIHECVTGQREV